MRLVPLFFLDILPPLISWLLTCLKSVFLLENKKEIVSSKLSVRRMLLDGALLSRFRNFNKGKMNAMDSFLEQIKFF
jgi:hypothetical protein